MIKLEPKDAALAFINKYFPNCQGALLAGSVVRGEATVTSDLDIIIFDKSIASSYREALIEFGWPIEVFVHNLHSYKVFFESDYKRARPSKQKMISEGIILKDEGILEVIKNEATQLLNEGPEVWSEETIRVKRYFITDTLDDLIGSNKREEEIFIANTLAELLQEFVLRSNKQWIGSSKWIYRALKQFDPDFAGVFVETFDVFYRTGNKQLIIELVDKVLQPHGGRLFHGFTSGKNN
ncbi:nucleotidyltransferase domain-containing protein [Peribacillus alkalitolerans]|uniref:nucleotidyltransferase domain-containing protein n=1 Tax=Peribacillus alkalitolerans TaxID=1550385 RepID=UPI0013CFC215|nr:nucleotidyltransferase domain-containing protein [Peribacillus alkalitolerans]